MNGRSTFVLLAWVLCPWTVACGGPNDASTTATQLDGTYRPSDPGAIGSISFKKGTDYLYMPSGCASQACAETGSYRIDGAQLGLENATGETRTIALDIQKTSQGSVLVQSQSLRPADLVNPGEQLAQSGEQLLAIITQALMNSQQMQQQQGGQQQSSGQPSGGQPSIPSLPNLPQQNGQQQPNSQQSNIQCQKDFPTKATPPAAVAAYWAACPKGP
jgi:hypothetical protein